MTLQVNRGGGAGGRERKAAIMWRVNASAVGERRRLRQREGKKRERQRGRSSLCSLPVETQGEMEEWMGGGKERTEIPSFPPPPIS